MGVKEQSLILTVEAGHSKVHIVLFRGPSVIETRNLSLESGFSPGILEREVASLIGRNSVRVVAGTSVNREISRDLRNFCEGLRAMEVLWFERTSEIPLKSKYHNPDQLGTDRALAALAAYSRFNEACIIIDMGSAITVDGVDHEGIFIGGTILPGPGMTLSGFHTETGLEIPCEITKPDDFPPLSTQDALRSGLFWGYVGALNELTRRMMDAVGGEKLVVTGGWSGLFSQFLSTPAVRDEHLVARGLYLCASRLASD